LFLSYALKIQYNGSCVFACVCVCFLCKNQKIINPNRGLDF
jgi:hypothetical protein